MEVRTRHVSLSSLALAVLASLLALSCSNSESPTSPGTASISGTLITGAGPQGIAPQGPGAPLANVTVTLIKTGQSTQTDATGNFTFTDIRGGKVELEFKAPGINAKITLDVAPGSRVVVVIAVSGSSAVVVSRSGEVEIKGTITAIDSSSKSFTVATSSGSVVVKTDSKTVFEKDEKPATFADLAVGQKVEVEGTPQSDGSILAREVEIEVQQVELKGTITAIDSAGKSFTLATSSGSVVVKTDAQTVFEKDDKPATFADLAVGQSVEVKGALQSDGSILARKVEIEEAEQQEVEVKGTIQSIDSASKSFSLLTSSETVTVKTDGATEFRGKDGAPAAFSDFKVGDRVEVKGVRQTDGSILARKVKLED